ncbi:MAG: DUF1559 domain-containing protein [Planctomycetes bacterium]|nr:DUF1559 domain-containing protein [Planctomycetota bacterium]
MPILLKCTCGKKLQVGDENRGKKVKCPGCGAVLTAEPPPEETAVQAEPPSKPPAVSDTAVQTEARTRPTPAEDDDDEPPRRRKSPSRPEPEKKKGSLLWIILGGCGVLSLFGCLCVGGGGYWGYTKMEAAKQRITSQNNLKQIMIAVHGYHDANRRFPPYATVHPQTKQMQLSWRVLLLPYLEQQNLYLRIRLDESWDSAHNRQFWTQMPKVYQLPEKPSSESTHYQVFFGDGGLFSNPNQQDQPLPIGPNVFCMPSLRFKMTHITDGTSNTLFVVEAARAVNWMKPEDIPFTKGAGVSVDSISNHRGDNRFHAGFADGSVKWIRRDIDPKTLHNLIVPDDGNTLDMRWMD